MSTHYPASDPYKAAKATVDLLTKMNKEDAAHEKSAKKFDQLDKEEQIAELIFQLRDQNGQQYFQPGSCDIFDTMGGQKNTPAHKLVELGYDAIPQLIEHLDDERFTRSVEFHRNFYFSHHVLRVSDCAKTIISRIARRSFHASADSKMTRAEAIAKEIADIKAWHADFVKKGEKQMLIEAAARGDRDSCDQARLLLRKYPNDALPAIIAGIKAAKDKWHRNLLIDVVASIDGDGPVPFLLAEVKTGPDVDGRVSAAQSLHVRGRGEGVAAMIAEWDRNASVSVADFLANCGRVDAVQALAKDFAKRPAGLRLAAVASFMRDDFDKPFAKPKLGAPEVLDKPEAVQAARETFLVSALDDAEHSYSDSGSWASKYHSCTRICDMAGHVLHVLSPARYTMDVDLAGPQSVRNRSVLALKGVGRKLQGLPPLVLAKPKQLLPLTDKEMMPLLKSLLDKDEAGRKKAQLQLEGFGLRALPGLQKRLEKLGKDEPGRETLDRLSRRLACTVVDVEFAQKSAKPDAPLAARLEALRGKPLDPEGFAAMVAAAITETPRGVAGFHFAAERVGDGSGFVIRLDLLSVERAATIHRFGTSARTADAKSNPIRWDYSNGIKANGKRIPVMGFSGATAQTAEQIRGELRDALTSACAIPVDQIIDIRLLLLAN